MRVLLVVIAASISGLCAAEDNDELSFRPAHADYAVGVRRFRFKDDASRIIGWQLADHWYFGKWSGDDSGFGFVWHGQSNQVGISDEGISWRLRFSLMNLRRR